MIIWINSPFDPLPGEGGRPLRYWLLSRSLAAAGYDVIWWSSDFHHVQKSRRKVAAVYEADGFQVRLVPTRPYKTNVGWSRWQSHAAYAAEWERRAREAVGGNVLAIPDCILTSLPPLGLFDAAARLREAFGCRIFVDVQDAWPETFYQLLPWPLRSVGSVIFAPLHAVAQRAYRGADGVSVVSGCYSKLVKHPREASDPHIFRLGIDLPPASPRRTEVSGSLRLVYVGTLGVSYDLETMVEAVCDLAMKQVPVTLDIAGDGDRRQWVVEAAAKSGGAIRFHGYLGCTPMRELLSNCDAGVVPMFERSWVAVPNKVIDYATAGLAMINGLAGETSSLLAAYGAGIDYEAGRCESFARAVISYARNRDLLILHAASARRLAEEIFDSEKIYPAMARWLTERSLRED